MLLSKSGDRKINVAFDQQGPAAFEISVGVLWVEPDRAIKVGESAVKNPAG